MSVDVPGLHEQCARWAVEPHLTETAVSAMRLLEVLPIPMGAALQFGSQRDWQLAISGRVVKAGTLEDCVTHLARMCWP